MSQTPIYEALTERLSFDPSKLDPGMLPTVHLDGDDLLVGGRRLGTFIGQDIEVDEYPDVPDFTVVTVQILARAFTHGHIPKGCTVTIRRQGI